MLREAFQAKEKNIDTAFTFTVLKKSINNLLTLYTIRALHNYSTSCETCGKLSGRDFFHYFQACSQYLEYLGTHFGLGVALLQEFL